MSSTSLVSNIPLWGQAYKLSVKYVTGTDDQTQVEVLTCDAWEPEALRITFEVQQSTVSNPWWFADISVYNLNTQTIQNALLNAVWVTLEAGFQYGPSKSSIIWDGPVLQTLLDRLEVVDTRITFHCVANPLAMDSIVSFSTGPFASQQQVVARMASEIDLPPIATSNGTLGQQAAQLMTKQYPRGKGVFGKVGKYLSQIANDNQVQTWRDGKQAYISEVNNPDLTPAIIYSPLPPPGTVPTQQPGSTVTNSIIGTPKQIPQGCVFTVLLDPRLAVKLPQMVVQIQRALISQQPIETPSPNSGLISPFNNNLTFFVAQVTHRGDSRSRNLWETEITGYSTTYAAGLPFGLYSPNSQGAGS